MVREFEGKKPMLRVIPGGKDQRRLALPDPKAIIETSERAIISLVSQINTERFIQPHDAAWLGGDYSSYLHDYLQGLLQSAHDNGELDKLGIFKVGVNDTEQVLTEAEAGRYYLVRLLLKDSADDLVNAAASLDDRDAQIQIEKAEKLAHLRRYIPENEQPFIRPQPAWLDKRFR